MRVYVIIFRTPYGTKIDSVWSSAGSALQKRAEKLRNYHKGEPVLIDIEEYVVNEGNDQK